jgi:hypothetical protein
MDSVAVTFEENKPAFDEWRALRISCGKRRNPFRYTDATETTIEMKVGKESHTVLADASSLGLLRQYTWYLFKNKPGLNYARTYAGDLGKQRFMHQLLLPNSEMVDHINGNGLDNRMENLRRTTAKGNANNIKLTTKNRSGVNGVTLSNFLPCWLVHIRNDNGKNGVKTFNFGIRSLYTKEEAFQRAVLFRRDMDARNGCTNGQRR